MPGARPAAGQDVADQVPGRACGRVGGAVPDRSQRPAQVEPGHRDLDEPPGGQVVGDGELADDRGGGGGQDGGYARAAYRNRTDDLRITRGPIPGRMHAMSTDTTDHRADGTRLAGTIQGSVPRAVPRPRPCVAPSCSLCVTSLRALPHAPMSMSRRNGATGYRPLPHAGLPACGCRSNQLATFFNGIAGDGPGWPPGPPVAREDIETAFARASAPARAWDGRRRSGSLLTVGACGQAMLQGRLPVRDSRLSSRPAPSRRTGCFPARRAVRDGPRRPR